MQLDRTGVLPLAWFDGRRGSDDDYRGSDTERYTSYPIPCVDCWYIYLRVAVLLPRHLSFWSTSNIGPSENRLLDPDLLVQYGVRQTATLVHWSEAKCVRTCDQCGCGSGEDGIQVRSTQKLEHVVRFGDEFRDYGRAFRIIDDFVHYAGRRAECDDSLGLGLCVPNFAQYCGIAGGDLYAYETSNPM